jgi:hypothetical protein
MSTAKRTLLTLASLVVLEGLTFYAYSLLWLSEGQPQNHGSRSLNAWAWVCIAAMVLEIIVVPLVVFRWLGRSRPAAERVER